MAPMVAHATIRPDADRLRAHVQGFVRAFGLLAGDRTPCGRPLSVSHAHALMVLLARGDADPPTQQELARALGIDKSNVTRLCARMASMGHAARRPCPLDARARRVALTAKGRRVAEQVEQASRARFAAVLTAVPRASRASLIEALSVLERAVTKASTSKESS